MFGLLSGIGVGVGAFLLILGVLFLLNVVLPRSRAKRSLETMQQDAMTIRLSLTERGLVGSSVRPGEETRIAWVSLQHAVDKEDCVEFYNTRLFIRVPKRCIPDMDELRRIVEMCIRDSPYGSSMKEKGNHPHRRAQAEKFQPDKQEGLPIPSVQLKGDVYKRQSISKRRVLVYTISAWVVNPFRGIAKRAGWVYTK